jgi:hypothetical protein
MDPRPARGISRRGLDEQFEAKEALKSALIMEARLLREQQDEAAASRFAEAAAIEEQLSELCEAHGLVEKANVHRFSAASCWAQAGNFYRAVVLCDDLLARTDLSARLWQRVSDYAQILRQRRAEWYAGLALEAAAGEG